MWSGRVEKEGGSAVGLDFVAGAEAIPGFHTVGCQSECADNVGVRIYLPLQTDSCGAAADADSKLLSTRLRVFPTAMLFQVKMLQGVANIRRRGGGIYYC